MTARGAPPGEGRAPNREAGRGAEVEQQRAAGGRTVAVMLPRPPDTAATTAPFQVMPPLSPEEYQALRADIAAHGVRVPVDVDEHGAVLDGHHRQRIAAEVGIPCPTRVVAGLDEAGKREHAFAVNLHRRQLGPITWAATFRSLAEARGVELNGHGNRHTPRAASVAALAEEVGVSPRTVRHRLLVADELAEHPDLAAKVDAGQMDVERARRAIREKRTAELRARPVEPRTVVDSVDIRHGDFRDVLADLENVDAIITDPPYTREWITGGGTQALGEVAARMLAPVGVLAVMWGNAYMDRAVVALDAIPALRYRGMIVWHQPGPHSLMYERKTAPTCKPVLLYDRGVRDRWLPTDYIRSTGAEKDGHVWQQNLDGWRRLVELLTTPGHLVVDPFLGSGTTAVACQQLGRRFVGCDIDPAAVQTARERLRNGAGDGD